MEALNPHNQDMLILGYRRAIFLTFLTKLEFHDGLRLGLDYCMGPRNLGPIHGPLMGFTLGVKIGLKPKDGFLRLKA